MKKIIIFMLIGISLMSIIYADYYADFLNDIGLNQNNPDKISIKTLDQKWQVIHQSGPEENLSVWIKDAKDKKTEIGFIIKDGMTYQTTDKILSYENNTPILDDKNKPITIKYETGKCDGQDCYHISLTDAQAVNINDEIKLGNQSIILEYQDINQVVFSMDEKNNITATLYWDINGNGTDWNNTVNDIFVYFNEDKWKFGAIHNDSIWERYKYVISSDAELILQGSRYFYITGNQGYWINTNDICSKMNNVTNQTADCQFIQKNNTLEIIFWSDYFIDPSFQFENTGTNSILTNVRFEGAGFTHLTPNLADLVAYYPFDVNTNVVYDYSSNNYDATKNGGVTYLASGKYGSGYTFDGINDYIDTGFKINSNFMSYGGWVYFNEQTSDTCSIIRPIIIEGDFDGLQIPQGTHIYTNRAGATNYGLVRFQHGNTTAQGGQLTGGAINDGQWHHLMLVANGTTFKGYLDGVSQGEANTSGTLRDDTNFFIGGSTTATGCRYFNGSIDDVMFINRTLSGPEVLAIYNNQSSRFVNNGYQNFNNTNVSSDSTENVLNITLSDYQNYLGSNISVSVNGTDYYNLSDTGRIDYLWLGSQDPNSINITFQFHPGYNNFYTPILFNFTVDSWTEVSGCTPNYLNTTLEFNSHISCLINNTYNSSYSYVTYDDNDCGATNVTHIVYIQNESCIYEQKLYFGIKNQSEEIMASFSNLGIGYIKNKLGIGTDNPQYDLHLTKNESGVLGRTLINIKTDNPTSGAGIMVQNDLGLFGTMSIGSSSYPTPNAFGFAASEGLNLSFYGTGNLINNGTGHIKFYASGFNESNLALMITPSKILRLYNNFSMTSPNGSLFNCGVDNFGGFNCT